MRFWLASLVFVAGLVTGSIGLVNQYENVPITEIVADKTLNQPTTYLFVPNSLVSSYDAPAAMEIRGRNVFVGEARESDILAWLGESPYVELKLRLDVASETVDLAEIARPGSGSLADPFGGDIWRAETKQSGLITLPVVQDGETGYLIAADGLEQAPREIRIAWDLPDEPAPVAPITYVGLALISLGGLMGAWAAFSSIRRNRAMRSRNGPRPPRRRTPRRASSQAGKNPRSGRRALRPSAMVAAITGISLLTGCVAEYENPILTPTSVAAPQVITPAITRDQVEEILADIELVVAHADENLDRESLEVRVAGPALDMRRFAYNLARRIEDDDRRPEPIEAGPIQLFLPPATDTWPRNVMVVTGEENLQMLVLRQEDPRDSYKLFEYMSLLPGVDFPEVASEQTGASALKIDNKFLMVSPLSLGEAVGDLLNFGALSSWTSVVERQNDYFFDVYSVQNALTLALSNANLSFQHAQSEYPIPLLSTIDGGALAAIYMIDTYTIIPKEPGDAVAISGDEAILLGTQGSATGLETRYGAMLLFHIPASGSEARVRLLGATQQLLTAVALGAQ